MSSAAEEAVAKPKRPIAIPAREPTLTGIPLPPASREARAHAPVPHRSAPVTPAAPAPALTARVLSMGALPAPAPRAASHAALPQAILPQEALPQPGTRAPTMARTDHDAAFSGGPAGPYPFGPATAEVDVSSFLSRSPLATVGGWMAEGLAHLEASGFPLRGAATLAFAVASLVGLAFTLGFGIGRTTSDAPASVEASTVAPRATASTGAGAQEAADAAERTAIAQAAQHEAARAAAARQARDVEAAAAEAAAAETAEAEAIEAARTRRTRRARLRRARARRRGIR